MQANRRHRVFAANKFVSLAIGLDQAQSTLLNELSEHMRQQFHAQTAILIAANLCHLTPPEFLVREAKDTAASLAGRAGIRILLRAVLFYQWTCA